MQQPDTPVLEMFPATGQNLIIFFKARCSIKQYKTLLSNTTCQLGFQPGHLSETAPVALLGSPLHYKVKGDISTLTDLEALVQLISKYFHVHPKDSCRKQTNSLRCLGSFFSDHKQDSTSIYFPLPSSDLVLTLLLFTPHQNLKCKQHNAHIAFNSTSCQV